MTEYENQLATLRMEVKRLQNYECHSKEISFQDLQTEVVKCLVLSENESHRAHHHLTRKLTV